MFIARLGACEMKPLVIAAIGYLIVLPLAAWVMVRQQAAEKALLNVSYDPTRELWRDLNRAFREEYERETGRRVAISQSHGASGSQARAVIDGLEADVISLALWSDTDQLRKSGLIVPNWDKSPRRTLAYYSTIIFVVRAGNPRKIREWDDLIRPNVQVITPSPKTSGNGKLSLLAAWGAMLKAGKSEVEAEAYVAELYRHAPVLDTGARGAAMTFAQKKIGDVHLTWENEGHLEVNESKGALEIVYPRWSIRAEPHVALVDANVDRRGTREVAQKYLDFLFTPAGQRIIAKHYYRPADDSYRDKDQLPDVGLFDLTLVAKDWDEAQQRFFADGGVFDRIYEGK
jgi:sulfate transport system substrate-binding protein